MVSAKGSATAISNLVVEPSLLGESSSFEAWEVFGKVLFKIDASFPVSSCLTLKSFSLNAFSLDLMVVSLNLSR